MLASRASKIEVAGQKPNDFKSNHKTKQEERKKMTLVLCLIAMLSTSRNCSGEVDEYSNLTYCELNDIERSVQQRQRSSGLPPQIIAYDSAIADLKQKRARAYLSYKYDMVCNECFERKLSCGNRKAGDTLFVCIDEGSQQ
jgi:hypothetical protein